MCLEGGLGVKVFVEVFAIVGEGWGGGSSCGRIDEGE